jgi:hypothetical protein
MKFSIRAIHIPQALLTFLGIFFSTMAVMPQFHQYQSLLIILAGACVPAAAGAASMTPSVRVPTLAAPSEEVTLPEVIPVRLSPPPDPPKRAA